MRSFYRTAAGLIVGLTVFSQAAVWAFDASSQGLTTDNESQADVVRRNAIQTNALQPALYSASEENTQEDALTPAPLRRGFDEYVNEESSHLKLKIGK